MYVLCIQVVILASLGVHGWLPLMLNAIYNSWAGFLNFVNSLLIDRFGRIRVISIGIVSSHFPGTSPAICFILSHT